MRKISLIIVVCLLSQNLFAGSIQTGNPVRKKSNSEAFSEVIYKKFEKLQEMIADDMYVEARAGLNKLLERRLNGFESAQVNQYIGWVDSNEGDYVAAIKRFQMALETDSLPNQAHFSMMLQIASMHMAGDNYQKGLDAIHAYYKVTDEIEDKVFVREANAYAQLEQYQKAIPVLKKAISLSEKPVERWYHLLYVLHRNLSQYIEAAKVLEILIAINPNKKEYWTSLSALYLNLKKDDKALAILALADENNLISDEKAQIRLFQMYSILEIPFKAGKVLEKGLRDGVIEPSFKRWEDLGKTWYQAGEMDSALIAYSEASKLSTDGRIDFLRGLIYFDRDDWTKTIEAMNSALEKGGLKDRKTGRSLMFLGMAESHINHFSKAIAALKKATKYKETRAGAYQWIEHLQFENKRARQIALIEKDNEEERARNAILDQ